MEDKEICVSLTHYENSDYKCDNSVLRVKINENNQNKEYKLTGITAESAYRLMKEVINISNIEESNKVQNQ